LSFVEALKRSRLPFLLSASFAALAIGNCQASGLRSCEQPPEMSVAQQDRLFRFGALIKAELDASGQSLALVARSGLDLSRFGMRYSHAGLSLKASQNTPWSVRQLYYACDEQKPRIFDQGMAGFLLGSDTAEIGYLSVVFLPIADAAALERAALDNRRAVQVLSTSYSANAYPYSLLYQNCNQWVMEMLALSWGGLDESAALRPQAQTWLKAQGYSPTVFEVGARPLMWLTHFIPWLHSDDHPADDLHQQRYRVSMPTAIEAFVKDRGPGAERIEFCHTDRHVVIRRGWEPIAGGCQPGPDDQVIALDLSGDVVRDRVAAQAR
jgi:hypothetical protein